jgi:hypothetical protein
MTKNTAEFMGINKMENPVEKAIRGGTSTLSLFAAVDVGLETGYRCRIQKDRST